MPLIKEFRSSTSISSPYLDLDPDKYRGTIGLIEDAPSESVWPHYTNFPSANKGDWVRVVSSTIIGDSTTGQKVISIGQEWVCSLDATEENIVSRWYLRQVAIPQETVSSSSLGNYDSLLYLGTLGLQSDAPTSNSYSDCFDLERSKTHPN